MDQTAPPPWAGPALPDHEERLRLALRAGRMGTWEWDIHGNTIRWSPDLEAIHGLPPGSFSGTYAAFLDEIYPDDRERVVQSITRTLEEGTEHHVEYRIRWPDGSVHWLEGRGRLFLDSSGAPLRMLGVCTDVTERKRAEIALVESEQRYKRLLESVTDYICTVRLEGGRPVETVHGPGCEAVTGYAPSAFAADPHLWLRMIAAEDRAAVLAQIDRLLAGEAIEPFEHRIFHKDGSARWVRNAPVLRRDERGRVTGYDGLISDITFRKNAEEAERHSQHRYESLVNTIDGIVWECDVNSGQPLFVSRQAQRLLGYTPDQWLREPRFWEDRLYAEDRERTLGQFAGITPAQPSQDIEYRMTAADGRTVWLRDLVRLVLLDGQPIKMCGVMVDVTERKRAEGELRQSEARKTAMLEASLDAIISINHKGEVLEWNPGAEKTFGYSRAQVLGKEMAALILPPRLRATHREAMARYLATGEGRVLGKRIELPALRADGTEFPVELVITRIAVEGTPTFTGYARDITDRKRAEEALQKSHGLLRAVIEGANDAIFVKDREGRYLMINTAGARLLGRTVEEVIGKDDTELFSAATAEVIIEGDRRVMAADDFQTYEDVGTAAGVTRTYLSAKGPYRDANGNVIGLIGISHDITERKLAERRLVAEHAVTGALAESANLQVATPKVLQVVCESLGWDVGLLWEVDRLGGMLSCEEVWEQPGINCEEFVRLSLQTLFIPGVGLPGRVWATRQPIWITEVVADPNFPRLPIARRVGLHSAFAFPVHRGEQFLGVLEFFSREVRQPEEMLLATMTSISSQLSQFIAHREVQKQLHQRQRELALAQQIQEGLLPRTPPTLAGFEMAGACRPTQETGGDYFDFIATVNGLCLAIGDASGHGIPAALLMTETRAYLRALVPGHEDVGQILTLANLHLVADIERDWFVTFFLAHLDPRRRTLSYCSAGHCTAFVLDRRGGVKTALPGAAIPLGIDLAAEYTTAPVVQLEPGDLVLLYTDGIVEARVPGSEPFGIDRMLSFIQSQLRQPARQIVDGLLQAVQEYCAMAPVDDMTAVILKVKDEPET